MISNLWLFVFLNYWHSEKKKKKKKKKKEKRKQKYDKNFLSLQMIFNHENLFWSW